VQILKKFSNSKLQTPKGWNLRFWALSFSKGFTLIEILVVIGIIGSLAGITTFSVTKSKDKGLDSRRKADLKAIETAAVAYYHDYGFYPPDPATYGGTAFSSDSGGDWIPGLESYINKTPKDPKQAGLLYFLASFFTKNATTGINYLAGIFNKPTASSAPQGQVAAASSISPTADTTDGIIFRYTANPCGFLTTNTAMLTVGQDPSQKERSFLSFDTSAIPDTATITSATLGFTLNVDTSITDFDIRPRYSTWTPPLDCSHYGATPPTETIAGTFSTSSLPAVGSAFNINFTNLSGINKTGPTKFMLTSSLEDSTTSFPATYQSIQVNSGDNASGKPVLTVNYTTPDPIDLIITDFHLTDAAGNTKTSFTPGEAIYPSVTIQNSGSAATTGSGGYFYISIYSNQPSTVPNNTSSEISVWAKETGSIAAGASKTYSITTNSANWTNDVTNQSNWSMATAGSYTARAFVDSFNHVSSEIDETNNQTTSAYTIGAAASGCTSSGNTDDFSTSTLNAAWNWYLPAAGPTYSLTTDSGCLNINVPNSQPYDHWGGADTAPQLRRTDMGGGDFTIETRLNLKTYTNGSYFHTGIMVYFSQFDIYYFGPYQGTNLRVEKTGVGPLFGGNVTYTNTAVSLKITKTGTSYKFEYKPDGGSWTTVGTDTYAPAVQKVGLISKTWSNVTLATSFDYFNLTGAAPSDPVAYWNLNENTGSVANDSSGNGINGTLVNNPTWVAGKCGSGLSLDGQNDNVNVGSSSIINPARMTAETWINPSTSPANNWGIIFARWPGATAYHFSLGDGTTNNKLTIYINTSSGTKNVSIPTTISLGAWHHVAFTYDGTNLNLYVDGTLSATTTHSGNITSVASSSLIGDKVSATLPFKGIVDEFKVYSRALSQAEIAADMSCPGTAPTVTTTAATGITATGATLNGTGNPNGFASTGWFRYSNTTPGTCNDTFGTRVPATGGNALGSGTTAQPFSQTVGSLTASTTYYFCALASNANGTGFGSVLSFTTSAPSPQCSDGIDNSDPEDTLVDYPADPGCSSAADNDETNAALPGSSADIKANGSNGPLTVNVGDSVSISWTSTSTTTCTVTGTASTTTSGSFTWTATTITTFNISCTGGSATDNVVVNVTLAGSTACSTGAFIYCYRVTVDRSSFVIWAQLDNTSDPETRSQPGAKCTLTPPAENTNLNYCIDSSTL